MEYLKLIRVKHYLKNLLVFLPPIFSGMLFDTDIFLKVIIMFLSFSFTSSIIYVINDINDIESDRKHPIKKNRPLASGKVSKKEAIITIIILVLLITGLLYFANLLFDFSSLILIFYFIINLGYSFGLKNIPLVDITILALGFVLRVTYGGVMKRTIYLDILKIIAIVGVLLNHSYWYLSSNNLLSLFC